MATRFRRQTLVRCDYDNLMRLAKVLGIEMGECPSKGWLADRCSQEMEKQSGPKPTPPRSESEE